MGGLDYSRVDVLQAGVEAQVMERRSDVRVAAASRDHLRVQFAVAGVRGVGGIAEAAGEVDVLEQQGARRAQRVAEAGDEPDRSARWDTMNRP